MEVEGYAGGKEAKSTTKRWGVHKGRIDSEASRGSSVEMQILQGLKTHAGRGQGRRFGEFEVIQETPGGRCRVEQWTIALQLSRRSRARHIPRYFTPLYGICFANAFVYFPSDIILRYPSEGNINDPFILTG